jgi:hypothetical protein
MTPTCSVAYLQETRQADVTVTWQPTCDVQESWETGHTPSISVARPQGDRCYCNTYHLPHSFYALLACSLALSIHTACYQRGLFVCPYGGSWFLLNIHKPVPDYTVFVISMHVWTSNLVTSGLPSCVSTRKNVNEKYTALCHELHMNLTYELRPIYDPRWSHIYIDVWLRIHMNK